MTIVGRIEPQPPRGIKYMLGNESWLPIESRSPTRLSCEEWGNLGPMELNREIRPNKAGFRVRSTEFMAPDGAHGFTDIDGIYYWTRETIWELADERAHANG
jgi:hypothetical protein